MPSQKRGITAINHEAGALRRSAFLEEVSASCESDGELGQWQNAEERMLIYLKSLRVTPEEQLGLALEAIRRARAQRRDHAEPIAACLETLWQILQERCMPEPAERDLGECRFWAPPIIPTAYSAMQSFGELAHPVIRRQCMTSAPMELAPWRRFIQTTADAVWVPAESLLYRRGRMIGELFALLIFISL